MIELLNTGFSYPKSESPALRGVTATIAPGIHLLAGENGAGKTTLLHLLAGLRTPSTGIAEIDGSPATSDNPKEMGRVFLLEENQYFPGKTIRDFASRHSHFYPDFSQEIFESNLKAFGLTGNESLRGESLGRKKKAQLAYVLALCTPILLLDEPTNALDIEGREALRRIIASSVGPERTLIVSTHSVADLENLFDGILILQKSDLVAAATTDMIEERLAFLTIHGEPDPEALYAETRMGTTREIIAADESRPTAPDWRMLYSALHSDSKERILEILRKS